MSTKTIIACRPGMQQQMASAFAGMTVIVDDHLTKDYEFRQEEMSLGEILEEEIAKEERKDADPKSAVTFVVPLYHGNQQDVPDKCMDLTYLTVRIDESASRMTAERVIRDTKATIDGSFPDEYVNVSATISALKAAFKKEDIHVYSISSAEGLVLLGG